VLKEDQCTAERPAKRNNSKPNNRPSKNNPNQKHTNKQSSSKVKRLISTIVGEWLCMIRRIGTVWIDLPKARDEGKKHTGLAPSWAKMRKYQRPKHRY
jgi:hypothetical protein